MHWDGMTSEPIAIIINKMGELVLLFGTECEQCLDKALCLF